jgi:hypothetical protein
VVEEEAEGGRASLDDYLASALSPRSDNEQDEYRDEDDEKLDKVILANMKNVSVYDRMLIP